MEATEHGWAESLKDLQERCCVKRTANVSYRILEDFAQELESVCGSFETGVAEFHDARASLNRYLQRERTLTPELLVDFAKTLRVLKLLVPDDFWTACGALSWVKGWNTAPRRQYLDVNAMIGWGIWAKRLESLLMDVMQRSCEARFFLVVGHKLEGWERRTAWWKRLEITVDPPPSAPASEAGRHEDGEVGAEEREEPKGNSGKGEVGEMMEEGDSENGEGKWGELGERDGGDGPRDGGTEREEPVSESESTSGERAERMGPRAEERGSSRFGDSSRTEWRLTETHTSGCARRPRGDDPALCPDRVLWSPERREEDEGTTDKVTVGKRQDPALRAPQGRTRSGATRAEARSESSVAQAGVALHVLLDRRLPGHLFTKQEQSHNTLDTVLGRSIYDGRVTTGEIERAIELNHLGFADVMAKIGTERRNLRESGCLIAEVCVKSPYGGFFADSGLAAALAQLKDIFVAKVALIFQEDLDMTLEEAMNEAGSLAAADGLYEMEFKRVESSTGRLELDLAGSFAAGAQNAVGRNAVVALGELPSTSRGVLGVE
ncbi:hypothetical protein FS749_006220 [Ceratobasidium sp. UAMH 11750]|nr:hypothetical protein FS749_006220 [Ceratobasidium sp. UAMH 11750]